MQIALRLFFIVAAGILVTGCAIHTREQIAAVRSAGVSAGTVRKLDGRGVLTPGDIIELRRRRVDDALVIRHVEKAGLNYVIQKDDIKTMRAAGVRQPVINAVVRASNRLVGYLYAPRPYHFSFGYWDDPFYSPFYTRYYGGPWSPYYGPWGPYGGPGLGSGYRRWR